MKLAGIGPKRLALATSLMTFASGAALTPSALAEGPAFSPLPGSPYVGAAVASGSVGENSVQFNATGSLAAITDWGTSTVTIDTVAAGGAMTPTSGSVPVSSPAYAAYSPNGSYLAVLSVGGHIYVYAVGSDGSLTAVPGSPFASVSGYGMAWSSDGSMLAVVGTATSGKHGIAIFSVAGNGALTLDAASATLDTGNPIAVAFSPGDNLLAVANQDGKSVGLYTIGAGAQLTHVTDHSTGSSSIPYWVAFNPATGSGPAQLALADYGSSTIDLFAASGTGLTLESSTSAGPGAGPRFVAFSPDGLLATANASNGSVSVFQLAADNQLTPLPGSPMVSGVSPTTVSFAGDGGVLAASNQYGNTVADYAVAAPTLSLSTISNDGVYKVGEQLVVTVSCADAAFAPGLGYCGTTGQTASQTTVTLPTQTIGSFTLTESAQSKDGQTQTTTVDYTVVGPAISIVRAHARAGGAAVELRCRGGEAGQACSGTVTLTAPTGQGGKRHELVLGRARYRLNRGHRELVKIRFSRAGRRILARHHRRALNVTISAGTAGRDAVQQRARLR